MIGGDLFKRFFLRFLIGLVLAALLFLPLVHLFQMRTVNREWQEDLRQEALWFVRHFRETRPDVLADAWAQMHSTVRVTFYDPEGRPVADSHPDRPGPDLEALRAGRGTPGAIATTEKLDTGGWLVMSRPTLPGFPIGMQWEVVIVAVLVVGLVLLLLYPLVRSISTTLGELGRLAQEVAAGHFGKTLDVHRSDELGALVLSFNDMSAKLAEAERLNTRLLHDVSHELRSPLGRIQVLAESIALRPDERDACIRGITEEVRLLDRLVSDLLQVARIEAGANRLRLEVMPLRAWADETLSRLEREVRSRQIDWRTRLPDAPRSVSGDPQRLAQAVGNLVDNAIHALEGHHDPQLEVALAVNADTWSLTVADNGPGIPADDLPHVFRRFYRVGEHRNRDGQHDDGVGLGLSVVRAIAEAHGGTASIESRPEGGTRVTLTLPIDGERAEAR